MPMFRKRPVEVEAWQYKGGPLLQGDPDWVAEKTEPVCAVMIGVATVALRVFTLHGPTVAKPNDWIIKGPSGDVWPCKPDIFAATYEPVEGK